MQNNISNINFTGAFRLRPSEIKAQREIPELFTQGRQIFADILEKGDQVIVVRDNYDKRIGNYIKKNLVNGVEYYPLINTKSGLDSERPEELINLLKNKTIKLITNFEEMFATIAKQRRTPKANKGVSVYAEIEKISNALRLNIENPIIKTSKNSTIIRDELKKRTIEVIMNDRNTSYVMVRPDYISEPSIRCLLNKKGELIKSFDTPNDIHKFYKNFANLKREGINILTK